MPVLTRSIRKIIATPIPEESSAPLTCTLEDGVTGEPIARAQVVSIHVSLRGPASVINGRDYEALVVADVLHATSGAFALPLGPDDHIIQSESLGANRFETHVLQLHIVCLGSPENLERWHEVEFKVENFSDVPLAT